MQSELSYLVSNNDIKKKLKEKGFQIKIMVYSELQDKQNMMELLPVDKCCCFILLRTSENMGHWTVLCRNSNDIYYFDSYGIGVDGEMTNISAQIRYDLGESTDALSRLVETIDKVKACCFKVINFSFNDMETILIHVVNGPVVLQIIFVQVIKQYMIFRKI